MPVVKKLLSSFWTLILLVMLSAPLSGEALKLEYYGEMGCSHCDLFQEKILPAAVEEARGKVPAGAAWAAAAGSAQAGAEEEQAQAQGQGAEEERPGLQIEAEYFDILSKTGFERCEKRLAELGLEFSVFPVLIIGNNAYQGNSAVEEGLVKELVWFVEHGEYLPEERIATGPEGKSLKALPGAADGSGKGVGRENGGSLRGIAIWPVFFAGLIDGVNPCAFATMLFFLSWITLRGGSKRRMIIAALGFILGVFSAYLVIGYGLFSFFRVAGTMGIIRTLVRYLFAGLAFLFALLSLRDAWFIHKSGKSSSMLLKLPKGLKRRIHAVIKRGDAFAGDEAAQNGYSGGNSAIGTSDKRGGFPPPLLFLSLLVTGMFVSVLELACTGQIYFPTIAYMVQAGEGTAPLLWLLLYNGAFILPLVGVFLLVLAGVSRQNIGSWFEQHLVAGKGATALLFLILGVLILLF